jgi:hypothetical protein
VLAAQSNHKLLVRLLLAVLVKDTHVCLATVESLGGFTETAGESVVDKGELENSLQGVDDGHLATAAGGGFAGRGDLNLLGGRGGGGLLFSVGLRGSVLVCGDFVEACRAFNLRMLAVGAVGGSMYHDS